MTTDAWTVLALFALVVLLVVLRSRDPDVRRRYDRWGVGHGRYSGRVGGWTGADADLGD